MDIKIRVFLIIATIISFYILIKSVKKSKLRTDYAFGWILASLSLIVLGVFPQIFYWISSLLGVQSPANIVFTFIIFILIVLVFVLFSKVSALEEKQKNLIQELAFLKKDQDEEIK